MIKINEVSSLYGSKYEKWVVNTVTNESFIVGVVNIQHVIIKYDGFEYMYLYDTERKVIENSFEYLNDIRSDEPHNTRKKRLTALELLYSYCGLFNVDLQNITAYEVKKLRKFLRGGYDKGGYVFSLNRSANMEEVNRYLSVYRSFFTHMYKNNSSSFHIKSITKSEKSNKGFKGHAKRRSVETYALDEKIPEKTAKVPEHIKENEFIEMVQIIRQQYSLRDEILVRLMYECGLRLGECLGVTLEDIIMVKEGSEVKPTIVLRNRLSDSEDQSCKYLEVPTCPEDYGEDWYSTKSIGCWKIPISTAIYNKIIKYIELSHGHMSKTKRNNYTKDAKACKATDGSNLQSKDNYYLFLNKNGTPLGHEGWNKILRKVFVKIGLKVDTDKRKDNLSHRLRHGFSMYLVDNCNYDELELMYALRHSDTYSVADYFSRTDEEMRQLNKASTESIYNKHPELKI